MKTLFFVASLLLLFSRCQATNYVCPAGSYIYYFSGKSGNAFDRIYSLGCSDGTTTTTVAVGVGGNGGSDFLTADVLGPYSGFRSGYWTAASQASSGFQLKRWSDGVYGAVFGDTSAGVTDRVCSGGQKMGGISASTWTDTSVNKRVEVSVDLLPICIADLYQCPGSSYITSINLNSGAGIDKINNFVCSDGGHTIVSVGVGGSGGSTNAVLTGPFKGLVSSDSNGGLAGVSFQRADGSFTNTFGSSATTLMSCIKGQYVTGFRVPQVWYSSTFQLVGGVSAGFHTICAPTPAPTRVPTAAPTKTSKPTAAPTQLASEILPTAAPTKTKKPTVAPTPVPTVAPTKTKKPTAAPTSAPTKTRKPTTAVPTAAPTKTKKPTAAPTSTTAP